MEVRGSEFAISRPLDFLPENLAFLRPFGIPANYTGMWSNATFGECDMRRTLPMLRTPPYTGNLIVMSDDLRLGAEWTVSWNHRGPVLAVVNLGNKYMDRADKGENYL